jgi:hypothetical protein
MWSIFLAKADARDERLSAHLARLVGTVWTWVQRASGAAEAGIVVQAKAQISGRCRRSGFK